MIAQPDVTSETMLKALAYSLAALEAAAELDIDCSVEDRAYFSDEKNKLLNSFEQLETAEQSYTRHQLKESVRLQARVILGDAVLDRGVRNAKTRLKLETRVSKPDAADDVFGVNIADLIGAPLRNEPALVQQALDRLDLLPEFNGKAQIKDDLAGRVERQNLALTQRDEGEMTRARLQSALVRTIADCSEALYKLEKRLLERFPRDRTYVRQFFMETLPPKRAKVTAPPQA